MSGGVTVNHTDTDPLFTGTHDGGSGSTLVDNSANFYLGAIPGLAIENVTTGVTGTITAVTQQTITAESDAAVFPLTFPTTFGGAGGPLEFTNGDEYKIYKTATKGSVISYDYVDASAGFSTRPEKLIRGWREKDRDLDNHGKYKVFGPGQPY